MASKSLFNICNLYFIFLWNWHGVFNMFRSNSFLRTNPSTTMKLNAAKDGIHARISILKLQKPLQCRLTVKIRPILDWTSLQRFWWDKKKSEVKTPKKTKIKGVRSFTLLKLCCKKMHVCNWCKTLVSMHYTIGQKRHPTCCKWMKRIQSSRSTSSDRFILLVMVEKMRRFCLRSGSGNSIFRSKRPGRRRAGSSVSALLVAIIT